jgi:hypothetical protein
MDLQIAFQGGGARLALLIPIVEALRELEGENKVGPRRAEDFSRYEEGLREAGLPE